MEEYIENNKTEEQKEQKLRTIRNMIRNEEYIDNQ